MEKMTDVYVVYERDATGHLYSDIVSVPAYLVDCAMTNTLRTFAYNGLVNHGLVVEKIVRMERAR